MTDKRLGITAMPRPLPPELTHNTPPLSLAWRAMRNLYAELERRDKKSLIDKELIQTAWITAADEYFRFHRLVAAITLGLCDAGCRKEAEQLSLSLGVFKRHLGENEVECMIPVGEPYSIEMSEWLLNIAQDEKEGIEQPEVREIIEPAVRYRGQIIRCGKAIISVPTRNSKGVT